MVCKHNLALNNTDDEYLKRLQKAPNAVTTMVQICSTTSDKELASYSAMLWFHITDSEFLIPSLFANAQDKTWASEVALKLCTVLEEEWNDLDVIKFDNPLALLQDFKMQEFVRENFTLSFPVKPVRRLQMRRFRGGGKVHKPVIYLYPSHACQLSVRVQFEGQFTHVYPQMDDVQSNKDEQVGIWNNVSADPSGILHVDGRVLQYLFWEGQLQSLIVRRKFKQQLEQDGIVVDTQDLHQVLVPLLASHGLHDQEINDFVVYWIPVMSRHDFVRLCLVDPCYSQLHVETNSNAITRIIRVFMVFCSVAKTSHTILPIATPTPVITRSTAINQQGVVVEWGGMELTQ